MSLSQLKARYTNSILGITWAVINPFLIMGAISFVFVGVLKMQTKGFALFVLSGIFPWMFFAGAVTDATSSILNQQNILRQFSLPREILPLSAVMSNFMNFLIGWLIIYPIFLVFNPAIIFLLPLLPLFLLLQLCFVCGLGLILSILNVFLRDTGQLLGLLLMFWFWVTPIFYTSEMVPEQLRWVCSFNPMTPFISGYREIIFSANVPSMAVMISAAFWALAALTSGLEIFGAAQQKILKRI